MVEHFEKGRGDLLENLFGRSRLIHGFTPGPQLQAGGFLLNMSVSAINEEASGKSGAKCESKTVLIVEGIGV